MRFTFLSFICFFFGLSVFAQNGSVTGKVAIADSKAPLAKASVFLSNSSFGTATADDGSFTLYNVKPGQYQLVVSSVGYKDYTQTILVGSEPINLNIQLFQKITELRGVVITTPADWKKNYEQFKKDFIGTSENAKKCVVVNPHVMNMINHSRKHELEAWSDDFLVVENRALGYRVKFLVDSFFSKGFDGTIEWAGKALFEELPGNAAQKKEWKLKREDTYYGSSRHFFKSLYTYRLNKEGFILRKLTRSPNPDRPPEEVILQKLKKFREYYNRDSLNFWIGRENMSRYYKQNLSKDPVQPPEVFGKTNNPGLFVISFKDCLYIIYTKKHEETDFRDVYRPLDMENFETSILTFRTPYAVFDMNGVVVDGAPLNEGTWSKAKLAELLPFNYAPEDDKKK